MLKPVTTNSEVELPGGLGQDWLTAYTSDFKRRMLCLLGFEFRNLSCGLAYSFMSKPKEEDIDAIKAVSPKLLEHFITLFDLKRLESYSKNLVDFHLVMDLVPAMARLYFNVFPPGAMSLSPVQAALLVGVGLQHKTIDTL